MSCPKNWSYGQGHFEFYVYAVCTHYHDGLSTQSLSDKNDFFISWNSVEKMFDTRITIILLYTSRSFDISKLEE